MKCEVTFDFLVEYTIKDVSKQLGVSVDDIEAESSLTLRDLFINGASDLERGELKVCDEYAREPEYYAEGDELFAQFDASYTVTVEGKDEVECEEKAEKAFWHADFGDYKYVEGCDLDCESREITPEKDDIERN